MIEKTIPLPSQFLRSRLINAGNRLDLEYQLEKVRQKSFPEKNSRMNCLFVFENKSDAKKAHEIWGSINNHFNDACLSDVEIINPYKFSKHDSNWISFYGKENFPKNWIDLYWNGDPCPHHKPLWEVLIDGRIKVLNQEMRQECYERLERDLKCHFLLRLSIMATVASSDLGTICSFLQQYESECYIFRYIIKFDEDEAIRVFKSVSQTHPQQASMIKVYDQDTLCISPDFSDSDYCLTHKCHPSRCHPSRCHPSYCDKLD